MKARCLEGAKEESAVSVLLTGFFMASAATRQRVHVPGPGGADQGVQGPTWLGQPHPGLGSLLVAAFRGLAPTATHGSPLRGEDMLRRSEAKPR
jgi:hypothetical protein